MVKTKFIDYLIMKKICDTIEGLHHIHSSQTT